MDFTPWLSLTPSQQAAAVTKWSSTNGKPPQVPFEGFEYHFSEETPYFRRLTPSVAKEETKAAPVDDGKKRKNKSDKTAVPEAPAPQHGSSTTTMVPRGTLRPCPFQPRKIFDDEKLNKMALSVRQVGVISPIVVRPCEDGLEIIAGEQRWRSSGERKHPETGEPLPALDEVPVIVRTNLTDAQVLELMLIENMHRADLSVIEESDAFVMAMGQRDAEGQPVYKTLAEFAEKIGMGSLSYIRERLALRKLNADGRRALLEQKLSFRTARVVCGCPESIIPLVLDEVLNPRKYDEFRGRDTVLTAEETVEVIHARHVRELRGAPFAQDDAALLPMQSNEAGERVEGGACDGCLWKSGMERTTSGDSGKHSMGIGRGRVAGDGKFCLNPRCFQKKVDVHVANELVKAKADGCQILGEKEAAAAIQHDGTLAPTANFVRLDLPPEEADRAKNLTGKCPTWEKIVFGEATANVVVGRDDQGEAVQGKVSGAMAVPVMVAVDKRGRVYRLADRKLAMEAARKNSTDMYLSTSGGRGRSLQNDDAKKKRDEAAEAAKHRGEVSRAIMGQLVAAIIDQGASAETWKALFPLATRHAAAAGVRYFEMRRTKAGDAEVTIDLLGKKLAGSVLIAAVIELLLAQDFAFAENPNSAGIVPDLAKPLLKLYGVDARAVEALVKRERKEKGKGKKGRTSNTQHPTSNIQSDSLESLPAGCSWVVRHGEGEKFEWNACGACTNPEVLKIETGKKERASLLLSVGEASGRWFFGYDISTKSGGCSAAPAKEGTAYPTRSEALREAVAFLVLKIADNPQVSAETRGRARGLAEAMGGKGGVK